MLKLALLGSPQLIVDGQNLIGEINGKLLALLIYLAVSEVTHTRDALADLLWSEMNSSLARKNLRGSLYELRQLLDPYLEISRNDAAFNRQSPHWLDVAILRTHLKPEFVRTNPQILRDTLQLYRGEFLAGFEVRNAPVFEEWMMSQRLQLHNLMLQGWCLLTEQALQSGDDALGLDATNHLLAHDATHEAAHRQRMIFLARTGQPGAALAQYTRCQQMLAQELGLDPAEETTALYEQIKAGAFAAAPPRPTSAQRQPTENSSASQRAGGVSPDPSPAPATGVLCPAPAIPLVQQFCGRQGDLARLSKWALVDQYPLLGVFGLAGQGKTQLVAHWVRTLNAATPLSSSSIRSPTQHTGVTNEPKPLGSFDCVLWASCLNTTLPALLQEWLGLLTGQPVAPPPTAPHLVTRLLRELQRKRCLLILDNSEEALQSGAHSSSYTADYAAFGLLLRQIATGRHRSTLILMGRTRPPDFIQLEEEQPGVRSLLLEGVTQEAATELFQAYGVQTSAATIAALHTSYEGHPLALLVAAETMQALFDGAGDAFHANDAPIFDTVRRLFDQQYVRLSALEQEILSWLAFEAQPVPAAAVWQAILQPQSYAAFLEALRSLLRQSLLETAERGLTIPKLLQAYIRQGLAEILHVEIQNTAWVQQGLPADERESPLVRAYFYHACQRLSNRVDKRNLRLRLLPQPAPPLPETHPLPAFIPSVVAATAPVVQLTFDRRYSW